MKPMPEKNDTVSVCGIGRSGRALINHLVRLGVRVCAFDDKELSELGDIPLWLSSLDVPLYAGGRGEARGSFVFRTPAMRPDHPRLLRAALRGAVILGETEYFAMCSPAPIYAVTGSDGKTTTATMLAGLLSAAGKRVYLGGNIGRSLLPFLDEMTVRDVCVLELSSFQLMDMECPLHAGVITNITPNHLNWHTGMAEYIDAKRRLALLASHRVLPTGLFPEISATRFSADGGGDFTLKDGMLYGYGIPLCAERDVRVAGLHNRLNLLAAAAAAAPLVTPHAVRDYARRFGGVPHRMACVAERGGVRYINSSIDTTPSRTARTLAAQPEGGRVLLLLGGRGKGVSYTPLTEALAGRNVKCFLFGEAAAELFPLLQGAGIPTLSFERMEDACQSAFDVAKAGDTVLLSPSATSYDAFPDFEARGECFCRLVEAYLRKTNTSHKRTFEKHGS